MVDPSGWRTEVGGSGLAFTDPSNFNPSVNPIDFDSNNVRQTTGNQSLENDPGVQRPAMLIDESSDSVQPSAFRAEFCVVSNNTNGHATAGVVFGFQDANNYFVAEAGSGGDGGGLDRYFNMYIGTVSSGSYSRKRSDDFIRPPKNSRWMFSRLEVEPVGAADLDVTYSYATLPDYKANGDSALSTGISFRWSQPARRSGALGVSLLQESSNASDAVVWLDGVQFYW